MARFNLSLEGFKRLPSWLAKARVAWWFIGSVILVWWASFWIGNAINADRVDSIRYAGWMLEIFGLLAVAFGLNNKLDLLDQKGIRERIREWGQACPLIRRDTVVGAMSAEIGLFGGQGRARLSASFDENAPIEDKVKFLMQAYKRLDDELGHFSDETRKDVAEIKAEIRTIENSLSQEIKAAASKSANVHVGDIGWEFAGLGWVLIGITLATVPELFLSLF